MGINLLCTIGHLDEAWDILPNPPMQTMIDIDGNMSVSCLCPNTDMYREYIAERYKILSSSEPDFIWIDDDFRIYNHGVYEPCFCPHCISKFNKLYNKNETFESLTSTLKNDANGSLAKTWKKFWIENYTELAHLIRDSIHSVNKNILIGEMTTPGDTHTEWLLAFDAVKARPGGGYYEDSIPRDIETKFLSCEHQIKFYPDKIIDCQYEFENFPYQELGKSKTITELEILYALMSGCDGVAFNNNFLYDNNIFMNIIRDKKALWDEIAKRTKNTDSCGIYCSEYNRIGAPFMDIGLPVTANPKAASAYVLTGRSAEEYSDDEILKILSGSVFIDGIALEILTRRGFGKYCGVKPFKYYDNGIMERFSKSNINGEYKEYIRSAWINFDHSKPKTATLELLDNNIEVLSDMITIQKKYLGPCMTLYENSLGGRVAVSTYLFPRYIQYIAKRFQLFSVFEWLLKGHLPIKTNIDHKIIPILRKNETGNYILMLANMSFDSTGNFTAEIKTKKSECKQINSDGSITELKTEQTDCAIKITIENIEPWKAVVLTNI